MRGFFQWSSSMQAAICLSFAILAPTCAVGQEELKWQIAPILIPADPDQQSNFIPQNYIPIESRDLERELARAESLRSERITKAPVISEAFYLATLSEQMLRSDASLLSITAAQKNRVFDAGRTSLNLLPPRLQPEGAIKLADRQSFSPQGDLQITTVQPEETYWFGFQQRLQQNAESRWLDLQVPIAEIASLIITTNGDVSLRTTDAPIERIESITSALPRTWPQDLALPSLGDNQKLWLIQLSSKRKLKLWIDPVETLIENDSLSTAFTTALDIEISQTSANLNLESELAAETFKKGWQFPLIVESGGKIQEIVLDDRAVAWQAEKLATASNQERFLVTLDIPEASNTVDRHQLKINALWPNWKPHQIPRLEIANTITLQGTTKLSGPNDTFIQDVKSNGPPLNILSGGNENPTNWQQTWFGRQPTYQAQVSPLKERWESNSVTKFEISSNTISARSFLRISSLGQTATTSNQIPLSFGERWVIDSVKLLGDVPDDVRLRLPDESFQDGEQPELMWRSTQSQLDLVIEAQGHLPLIGDQSEFCVCPLIQIEAPQGRNVFALSSSDGTLIDSDSQLNSLQVNSQTLDPWMKSLLGDTTPSILLRSDSGEFPTANILRSRESYSATIAHIITDETIDYRIQIDPISQSITEANFQLQVDSEATEYLAIPVNLVEDLGQDIIPLSQPLTFVASQPVSGLLDLKVVLPRPLDQSFQLSFEIPRSNGDAKTFVSTLSAVDASAQRSVVLLAPGSMLDSLRHVQDEKFSPSVRVLPQKACCDDPSLARLAKIDGEVTPQATAIELATNAPCLLTIDHSQSFDNGIWISQETVIHQFGSSAINRETRWLVEVGPYRKSIEVEIPSDWTLLSILVDGSQIAARHVGNIVKLPLPASKSVVDIRIKTRSASLNTWFKPIPQDRVGVNAPTFQSQQIALIPSSHVVWPPLPEKTSNPLVDRLLPSNWWSLCSPAFRPHTQQLPIATLKGRWLVNRASVCALAICCLCCLSTFMWLLLSRNLLRWTIASITSIGCVLLVNYEWLPYVALLPLSLGLVAVTRAAAMIQVLSRVSQQATRPNSVSTRRYANTSQRNPGETIAMIGLALGLSLVSQNVTLAQTTEGANRQLPSTPEKQLFGILVPTDKNLDPVGNYVYVPQQLWTLLSDNKLSRARTKNGGILSASYQIDTVSRGNQSLLKLIASYRLQITNESESLNLPFKADEVRLIAGQVNGQSKLIGLNTLTQNADENVVTFTPKETGITSLELEFEVSPTKRANQQYEIKISVPPIPNATFSVAANLTGQLNFVGQQAIERSQLGGATTLDFGPQESIHLIWEPTATSVPTTSPTTSAPIPDTWVHASENRLIAGCQLVINREWYLQNFMTDSGLKPLRISINSDWKVVGNDWGADVDTVQVISTSGGRKSYSIVLKQSTNEEQTSALIIRTIAVPKDPSVGQSQIAVPFLRLPQQMASPRFAWSVNDVSADSKTANPETSLAPFKSWRPDGIDFWQKLPATLSMWDSLKFGTADWSANSANRPQLYSVPYTQIQLSRDETQTLDQQALASRHQLSILPRGLELNYILNCKSDLGQTAETKVYVPEYAAVEKLTINGQTIPYLTVPLPGKTCIQIAKSLQRRDELALLLSLPKPTNPHKFQLPVCTLATSTITPDSYEITWPQSIQCHMYNAGNQTVSLDDTAQQTTQFRSQLTLREELKDAQAIFVGYQSIDAINEGTSLSTLVHDKNQWSLTFNHVCSTKPTPRLLTVEFPSSLRESLDSIAYAHTILAIPDSERSFLQLLVPPQTTETTLTQVNFKISEPRDGEPLLVPEIKLANSSYPANLVLAKKLKNGKLSWSSNGDRNNISDAEIDLLDSLNGFSDKDWIKLRYPSPDSLKLRLREPQTVEEQELIRSETRLLSTASDSSLSLVSSFWFNPRGATKQAFSLPRNATLAGVTCNGKRATWRVKERNLTVLFQPNFLPSNIRLHWKAEQPTTDSPIPLTLDLPQPSNTDMGPESFFYIADKSEFDLPRSTPRSAELIQDRINTWCKLLSDTLNATESQISVPEKQQWLRAWSPESINIQRSTTIDEADLPILYWVEATAQLDLNNDGIVQVGELWLSILANEKLADLAEPTSATAISNTGYWHSIPNAQPARLQKQLPPTQIKTRVTATSLCILAIVLGAILLGRIQGHLRHLAQQYPWSIGLVLAGCVWLLFPVAWPALLICLLSICIAYKQLFRFSRVT